MNHKNKSTEKLQAELIGLKGSTGALIGVSGLLIAICIYGLVAKGDKAVFIP